MKTALKRVAVVVDDDPIEDGRKVLAKQAAEVLGYRALGRELERKRNGEILGNIIKELGIEPYSEESVDRYKRRMSFSLSLFIFNCLPVVATVAGVVMVMGIVFMIATGHWLSFVVFGTGFALFAESMIAAQSMNANELDWVKIPISDYMKPIPEFALQTAVSIATKSGSLVNLYIEELVTRKRTLDPFLVAVEKDSGKTYYLEVWNEPKFK